ncbi:MAG TPA: hypothetical protein DEB74_00830 [Lachnospiraceae bacterium]|jgi:hypothetical protein|nr:hypothetical protein [Lachnospiraceae bacterium]
MAFQKERMSSYVDRGNKLIADGKMPEAMKLVEKGLQHYSEKIISAISPYAKADAGLIVLVLRHLADEVERGNPGAKELYEGMKKCINAPSLTEIEKVKKANRR